MTVYSSVQTAAADGILSAFRPPQMSKFWPWRSIHRMSVVFTLGA